MNGTQGQLFVGTSGWIYPHWGEGVFYPSDLPQTRWLTHYARHFSTVEVNNTFYHLPRPEVFSRWAEATPDDFVFAVKASRYITHMKKLRNAEEPLARLYDRIAHLGDKLGPILFQLPPFWNVNTDRLHAFLDLLGARDLPSHPRITFELRNPTWLCSEVLDLLSEHHIALCLHDWPDLPVDGPLTADFVYLRRHGAPIAYASPYPDAQLQADARRLVADLQDGRDVYVYFNNDAYGWAVQDAMKLRGMVQDMAG